MTDRLDVIRQLSADAEAALDEALRLAFAEIDTLHQRVETAEQERDTVRKEIAELHDIVSAYDAITDPTEHPDLNERAFKALGDGADHTICRMLETAEARIVELEAERDAFRAEIRDVIGYLEEPHDTGR